MINPTTYAFLCQMLKERSGLILSGDKQYLIESRLMPVARRHGAGSLEELVNVARSPAGEKVRVDITEAMTTNESFFYRDKTPFENFEKLMLPELLKARANQRRLRIWCSAASTGQEPYSLAMCLKEQAALIAGWRIEIIGTDISLEVLEKAKIGMYSQFEVQRGLPIQLLVKYFKQVGDMWQIDPAIRAMVQYRPLNLLQDFSSLGTFDIVFCRNVLIYFEQQTKSDVLNRIAKVMTPDGYLVLGAAETVIGLTDQYRSIEGYRGLYAPAGKDKAGGVRPAGLVRPAVSAGAKGAA